MRPSFLLLFGVLGSRTDAADEISVDIGVDLWNQYGYKMRKKDLHIAILRDYEFAEVLPNPPGFYVSGDGN